MGDLLVIASALPAVAPADIACQASTYKRAVLSLWKKGKAYLYFLPAL